MTTYIALLRSINVGGHNKIPMTDLRAAIAARGFVDVQTYIQSGNAVFRGPQRAGNDVGTDLEAAISDAFGLSIAVIIRTAAEMAALVAAPAFPALDNKGLYVTFLRDAPKTPYDLDPQRSPPDRFAVIGRDVHLDLRNGAGKTKLTLDYLERRLGTTGTARNWNTVTKLAEMSRTA